MIRLTSYDKAHHIQPSIIQPTFEHQRPQEPRSVRKPRSTLTPAEEVSMGEAHTKPIWQLDRATSVYEPPVVDGLEYIDGGFAAGDESDEAQ